MCYITCMDIDYPEDHGIYGDQDDATIQELDFFIDREQPGGLQFLADGIHIDASSRMSRTKRIEGWLIARRVQLREALMAAGMERHRADNKARRILQELPGQRYGEAI